MSDMTEETIKISDLRKLVEGMPPQNGGGGNSDRGIKIWHLLLVACVIIVSVAGMTLFYTSQFNAMLDTWHTPKDKILVALLDNGCAKQAILEKEVASLKIELTAQIEKNKVEGVAQLREVKELANGKAGSEEIKQTYDRWFNNFSTLKDAFEGKADTKMVDQMSAELKKQLSELNQTLKDQSLNLQKQQVDIASIKTLLTKSLQGVAVPP